jgi:hypothetical protein
METIKEIRFKNWDALEQYCSKLDLSMQLENIVKIEQLSFKSETKKEAKRVILFWMNEKQGEYTLTIKGYRPAFLLTLLLRDFINSIEKGTELNKVII